MAKKMDAQLSKMLNSWLDSLNDKGEFTKSWHEVEQNVRTSSKKSKKKTSN